MDNKTKKKTENAPKSNLLKFAAGALLFFAAIPACSLLANIQDAIKYRWWGGVIYCVLYLVILFLYIKWIRVTQPNNGQVTKSSASLQTTQSKDLKSKLPDTEETRLIAKLKYGSKVDVQIAAIKKLGELKAKSAIDSLVMVAQGKTVNMQSGDLKASLLAGFQLETLREEVARALGEIGDPKAIIPLIALLKRSDSGYAHISAQVALKKIGEPAVLPLIAALKINEKTVRLNAAKVLEEIGDERANGPLKEYREIYNDQEYF